MHIHRPEAKLNALRSFISKQIKLLGLFDKIFKSGKSKGNKEVRLPKIEVWTNQLVQIIWGMRNMKRQTVGFLINKIKKITFFILMNQKQLILENQMFLNPENQKEMKMFNRTKVIIRLITEPDKSNNQDKGWHADGYGKIVDKNGNFHAAAAPTSPSPHYYYYPLLPPPPPPPFQPAKPVHKHAIKNCIRDQRRIRIGDSRRKTDTKITIACAHHGRHWDIMNVQDVFEIVPDKTDNNYQPSSSIRPIYTAEEMNPKYKEEITITWVSNQPDPKRLIF